MIAWLRWWPLAAALAAFAAGWQVNGWRIEAERVAVMTAQRKAQIARQDDINTKAEGLEKKLAANEANRQNLARRLTHETRKDAYRCPLPASGVQLLNDALRGVVSSEPDQPGR